MNYKKYMEIGLEEAKTSLKEGNKGFGAVIVKDDKILARSHDTEVTDNDPTSHAEMNCIKKVIKCGKELENTILISTHEPCPMCMTAIILSKIYELIYSVSIEDSLKQGRNRINISSEEIKNRSNSTIIIKKGILKEKCMVLYDSKVREYVKQFRNSRLEEWKLYGKELLERRKKWFHDNQILIDKLTGSDIEIAYKLLSMKFKVKEEEIPIIEKTNKKLVFHSRNFCPSLEACKILGLDTRMICKAIFEESTDGFIKLINPELKFTRNYEKIRPYKDYCEEIIYRKRT
ncbi:MAG: nucleoside deaminase [Promethearchaeota archaeon]